MISIRTSVTPTSLLFHRFSDRRLIIQGNRLFRSGRIPMTILRHLTIFRCRNEDRLSNLHIDYLQGFLIQRFRPCLISIRASIHFILSKGISRRMITRQMGVIRTRRRSIHLNHRITSFHKQIPRPSYGARRINYKRQSHEVIMNVPFL